jgi:aspartate kinase
MIVMKFGGTSNKDAAAMSNVIRIVKDHLPQRPVVVISAIAKATNELEESARTAASGDATGAEEILSRLFARHGEIVRNLLRNPARVAGLMSAFSSYGAEIRRLVQGVAVLKELTPRTLDAFCSYGERLSSRIIAAGLEESGVAASWIDVKDFMLTDDNFGRALPLTDAVTTNLERVFRPLIGKGIVPVTQGFIGISRDGIYTTMGRESSDYSASIIGACMNAERVQIWTDVDGILTADPRMVGDVMKVQRMSFEEAFELSYFGAKILHPNTMLPLLEKNIPVEIRNSRREGGTGTLVNLPAQDRTSAPLVKSIAFKNDVTVVTVSPLKRLNPYLFWESIFSVLNRCGITTGNVSTSEYSIAFTIDGDAGIDTLQQELERYGNVTILAGKGSVCIVGSCLRGGAGLLDRVFKVLSDVNITMVAYGASAMNFTLVVDGNRVKDVLTRLHREFFGDHAHDDVFSAPVN